MAGRRALAVLLLLTVLAFAKEPKLKIAWIQAAPGILSWPASGRRSGS